MLTISERENNIKRFCEKWNKIYADGLQKGHPLIGTDEVDR